MTEIGQDWREDSSNRDLRHARNRVRHGIMPRLERTLNPRVKEALAETADIARSEEEYWQKEVERVLPEVWQAPRRHAERIGWSASGLAEASGEGGSRIAGFTAGVPSCGGDSWAGGGPSPPCCRRDGLFHKRKTDCNLTAGRSGEFDFGLCSTVCQCLAWFRFRKPGHGLRQQWFRGAQLAGYNPDHMLDPALLQKELTVRNWRAGDRYWPAHSKAPKKIKELLQERKLTGTERKLWPVVVSGQEIVWVRGFPTPARLRPRERRPRGPGDSRVAQSGGRQA